MAEKEVVGHHREVLRGGRSSSRDLHGCRLSTLVHCGRDVQKSIPTSLHHGRGGGGLLHGREENGRDDGVREHCQRLPWPRCRERQQ